MEKRLELVGEGALSVPEAARLMGVGRTTIYDLMKSGKLPYCQLGAKRVIPRKAVELWLAENLVMGNCQDETDG